MYLGLARPWQQSATPSNVDAQPAVADPAQAPAKSKGRKRKPPRTLGPDGTATNSRDAEESDSPDETGPVMLSGADRASQTVGADFSLPPAKLDLTSNGDEARTLTNGEINDGLGRSNILDCVLRAATGTDLQATITVKLLVDGGGRVTKHRLTAPKYLQEHGLPACVSSAVGKTTFAATGAPTLVTAPFALQP
jgi:hypothetical protein